MTDAVRVLPPSYSDLLDRFVAHCDKDDRVRALWLGGSVARGDADAVSDLDLMVAVADDRHDDFVGDWRAWLAAVTDTVWAEALPFLPGSFYAVTDRHERVDLVVEKTSAIPTTFFRTRLVVLDKDGLHATVPKPEPGPGPSKEKIDWMVREFFRDYGMFDVVVVREDWLLGVEACQFIARHLYQLFVEANAPLPPMGVKRWSDKLTPDQRAVLAALPGATADRESVMAAHEAIVRAFVDAARPICQRLGVAWPDKLEAVTLEHLRSQGLPTFDN